MTGNEEDDEERGRGHERKHIISHFQAHIERYHQVSAQREVGFIVNELMVTSSTLWDQYRLVCSFEKIFPADCMVLVHVCWSTDKLKLLRRPKGATYPPGLDLIHVERQEKLRDSLQANPILFQLKLPHSILKHNNDHQCCPGLIQNLIKNTFWGALERAGAATCQTAAGQTGTLGDRASRHRGDNAAHARRRQGDGLHAVTGTLKTTKLMWQLC